MTTLLPTNIKTILVIYIALCLVGCENKKTITSGCDIDKSKIVSENAYAPYELATANDQAVESMRSVKENLKHASSDESNEPAVSALRAQALRETALSIGARGGLAERAQQINSVLLAYEPMLAKIFQFYGILLDDNILPPVLVEARNTLNLSGTDAIRIADRNYKVLVQARFVTAPPTWREYLWMSYGVPELPDRSLLPRNKPERIMWERDLEEGWQAGLRQADLIYTENINRLVRDFNGMILYRKLLAQNMVSPPYVAAMDMGVTGDGEDMTVNDRVLRITAFPQLQASGEGWKTEIRSYE